MTKKLKIRLVYDQSKTLERHLFKLLGELEKTTEFHELCVIACLKEVHDYLVKENCFEFPPKNLKFSVSQACALLWAWESGKIQASHNYDVNVLTMITGNLDQQIKSIAA